MKRKKLQRRKRNKIIILFFVILSLLSFLSCKDKNKIVVKKIKKNKSKIVKQQITNKNLIAQDNLTTNKKTKKFIYDVTEIKRDPFMPFLELKQEKLLKALLPKNIVLTPLNEYSIDQYKLVGIMTDKKPPLAMVETVDKKGFIFSIGDYIGSEFYKVIAINVDYVLLEKRYLTYDKKIKYEKKYLKIDTSGE